MGSSELWTEVSDVKVDGRSHLYSVLKWEWGNGIRQFLQSQTESVWLWDVPHGTVLGSLPNSPSETSLHVYNTHWLGVCPKYMNLALTSLQTLLKSLTSSGSEPGYTSHHA